MEMTLTAPAARDRIAQGFAALASEAGLAIMDIYAQPFEVRSKADDSPVSAADEAAEAILLAGVAKLLPGVPVVAEEAMAAGQTVASDLSRFILIDPLDGTREFIAKNGEFTVNIALIEQGRPVAGCVYAPAINRMFIGGSRAWVADVAPGAAPDPAAFQPITTRAYPDSGLTALASRSHADPDTQAFIAARGITDCRAAGSSLKFCVIAAGEADVYPRFGPTMEWDIAAGHAVLAAAGGQVVAPDGSALGYGKSAQGFRNGAFVAWGQSPVA